MKRYIKFEQIVQGVRHEIINLDVTDKNKGDEQIIEFFIEHIRNYAYTSVYDEKSGAVIVRDNGPVIITMHKTMKK